MCDTWQAMCPHACQWRSKGNQFVEEERNKKEMKGKKIKKEKKNEEREKEIEGRGNRRSDVRNLSYQEVKFVYSTRATL